MRFTFVVSSLSAVPVSFPLSSLSLQPADQRMRASFLRCKYLILNSKKLFYLFKNLNFLTSRNLESCTDVMLPLCLGRIFNAMMDIDVYETVCLICLGLVPVLTLCCLVI